MSTVSLFSVAQTLPSRWQFVQDKATELVWTQLNHRQRTTITTACEVTECCILAIHLEAGVEPDWSRIDEALAIYTNMYATIALSLANKSITSEDGADAIKETFVATLQGFSDIASGNEFVNANELPHVQEFLQNRQPPAPAEDSITVVHGDLHVGDISQVAYGVADNVAGTIREGEQVTTQINFDGATIGSVNSNATVTGEQVGAKYNFAGATFAGGFANVVNGNQVGGVVNVIRTSDGREIRQYHNGQGQNINGDKVEGEVIDVDVVD